MDYHSWIIELKLTSLTPVFLTACRSLRKTLNDLLFNDKPSNSNANWLPNPSNNSVENSESSGTYSSAGQHQDVVMCSVPVSATPATPTIAVLTSRKGPSVASSSFAASVLSGAAGENPTEINSNEDTDEISPAPSTAVKDALPETVAPSCVNSLYGTRSSTSTGRPTLTLRKARSPWPSATAASLNPALLHGSGKAFENSAPGGVKVECSNCGTTHTPLWRRGLNDELNCNACGLYCKSVN